MASTSAITQSLKTNAVPLTINVVGGSREDVPDWIRELRTRGWTVVTEAISKAKALAYADKAHDWLESWGLGYNRNDPSTLKAANLPFHHRGGIFARYGVAHEQWVWDLRSEPDLVDKFAQIWGTNELLVSYDGVNLSIPESERPKTDPVFAPWAHVDQSPLRTNLQCIQGIVHLLPNGPEDGGLMVLDGSNALYPELWQHFDHKKGEKGWNKWEQQFLDEEMCQWLESKGCKWAKVCAQPGDLLLWDSRTVHYGASPSSTNPRFAHCKCQAVPDRRCEVTNSSSDVFYKPASLVSEETKKDRLEAFATKNNTAHDPSVLRVLPRLPPEDHPSYSQAVSKPLQEPVLSKRARKLCGLDPY